MADDITIKFVRNVRDTPFEVIQPEAIQRAKIAILDIIAVSLAAFESEISTKVRATVGSWGGRPDSRIFFTHERLPAHNAALVNATMSRVLDFDDTFRTCSEWCACQRRVARRTCPTNSCACTNDGGECLPSSASCRCFGAEGGEGLFPAPANEREQCPIAVQREPRGGRCLDITRQRPGGALKPVLRFRQPPPQRFRLPSTT